METAGQAIVPEAARTALFPPVKSKSISGPGPFPGPRVQKSE